MSETMVISFTKNSPTLTLKQVAPEELPITMAESVVGATPNANDMEGFSIDPLAYYILSRN